MGKLVTEEELDERLLSGLLKKKVGTYRIECQALELVRDAEKRNKEKSRILNGKSKWETIKGGRDPEKVADVLKLKLEYCKAKKNELKKEYRKEKKHLEECHQREGQQRKFRKIISRIAKQEQDRWAKGLRKLSDKIEWAEKKFKPPEPASAFKDWAKRIATGRGKGRQKHRFKVKYYGGPRVD